VARGGRTQGYALHLADGHAVFTVTANNTSASVTTEQTITGAWTHLTGVLDAVASCSSTLMVSSAARQSRTVSSLAIRTIVMQIGADLGSPVLGDRKVANFNGLIASVRLFSGERLAKDIAADAARK
jgi:hypothetical protein